MNISFYEKIQIAAHIERKINSMNIADEELKKEVYDDIEQQIKREYGLSPAEQNIDKEYLADLHDMIDCYTLPRTLEERNQKSDGTLDILTILFFLHN